VNVILAHESCIAFIAFDSSGLKMATASSKGTVIRVFTTLTGNVIFEFRRGVRRYANIYSLSFSPDSKYLCASSNLETIHIFRLENHLDKMSQENPTWSSYLNRAMYSAVNYLPTKASTMFNQDRAFAYVHLPEPAVHLKNISSLALIHRTMCLLVASENGCFYIYEVNLNDGGECKLIAEPSTFRKISKQISDANCDLECVFDTM